MSGFVYEFNHRGKQFHLQWLYHAALSITYAQLGKTRNITPFHHLCQLCRSQHQCERGSKLHRTIQLLLSPVHAGDKLEFNTVHLVESRLLPKPATNRRQREFDILSRSTLLPLRSTLSPVCAGLYATRCLSDM